MAKSSTPVDVLARQKAERRIWAALQGLSPEDQEFVVSTVYRAAQESAQVARNIKYGGHLLAGDLTGSLHGTPTPAGHE